jgi:hypothetical protein
MVPRVPGKGARGAKGCIVQVPCGRLLNILRVLRGNEDDDTKPLDQGAHDEWWGEYIPPSEILFPGRNNERQWRVSYQAITRRFPDGAKAPFLFFTEEA